MEEAATGAMVPQMVADTVMLATRMGKYHQCIAKMLHTSFASESSMHREIILTSVTLTGIQMYIVLAPLIMAMDSAMALMEAQVAMAEAAIACQTLGRI